MIKKILILLVVLSTPLSAFGITLTNGVWTSSYDCADWMQTTAPESYCGFVINGAGCASFGDGATDLLCDQDDNSMSAHVLASANNPDGVSGTAAHVHYFATGTGGVAIDNQMSATPEYALDTPVSEAWWRWYVRYDSDTVNAGWKMMRMHDSSSNELWMAIPKDYDRFVQVYLTVGAGNVYSPVSNITGDYLDDKYGQWVAYEVHVKGNPNGVSSGVLQVWIDGILAIDEQAIDTGLTDIADFASANNGSGISSTSGQRIVPIWHDDLAIADSTYTGFVDDGNGYDRIGLLSTSPMPGVCGDETKQVEVRSYGCTSGTSTNHVDGATTTTWDCEGAGGSVVDDNCSALYSETPINNYNILTETWETNTVDNWDDDYIQGDTRIDTNPVYEGTYAIKMESSEPGNYVTFFGDHLGVDGDMVTDVTVEEYYYMQSDFSLGTGLKLWVMNAFESWSAGYSLADGQSKPHTWAAYYMTISIDGDGAPYGQLTRADGLGGTGTLWQNYWPNVGTDAMTIGAWNKLKYRLKLNTLGESNGVFQLWVDDVLQCDYSNVNYRGTYDQYGWNHLMLSMDMDPDPPSDQWISRDNITITSGETTTPAPESTITAYSLTNGDVTRYKLTTE